MQPPSFVCLYELFNILSKTLINLFESVNINKFLFSIYLKFKLLILKFNSIFFI